MKIFYTWSEAIRAGITLRPVQAFRAFFDSETGGTCANGAALEAIFGEPFTNDMLIQREREVADVMREHYSQSLNHYVELPCHCDSLVLGPKGVLPIGRIHRLDHIIVHLNNHDRWTREQIADWLEGEEEKLGYVTLVEETAPV